MCTFTMFANHIVSLIYFDLKCVIQLNSMFAKHIFNSADDQCRWKVLLGGFEVFFRKHEMFASFKHLSEAQASVTLQASFKRMSAAQESFKELSKICLCFSYTQFLPYYCSQKMN